MDWLAEYTTTDYGRWTDHPFSIQVDGEPWSGATTGMMAVLVRGASAWPVIPSYSADVLLRIPRERVFPVADYAAFRAWCLDVPGPQTCRDCKGKPPVICNTCDGDGKHDCDCGTPHDCGDCRGEGQTTCKECRGAGTVRDCDAGYARLYGIPINRVLLDVLHYLDAAEVRIATGGEREAFLVLAPNWRVIVMPLTEVPNGVPEWPAVEVAACDIDADAQA